MGASCALRRYPQQPTGAGPPGVREESAPKTATADVSLPFCKKRIEKGKGVGGGSSATHEAVKTGVYETAPARLGQVSEKGGVNRDSTRQILRGSCGLDTQWNLQGLEVSEVEWSWRCRQEVTGVATEEAAGRRGGDAQRR